MTTRWHRSRSSARRGRSPARSTCSTPAREGADRRRAVPGAEGAARAQLAGPADRRRGDRRHRPHARAPRSLRLPAAARRAGISRARVLHGRHPGSLPHRPAGLRPHPGRGRRATPTGTATRSTRRRCRSTPRPTRIRAMSQLQPVGYDRPMPVRRGVEVEFINAGHLLGSAYARMRTGGQHDPLRRRSRPLRPSGAAGSDDGRPKRTTCWSSRPTATASTSRTTTARSWRAIDQRDGGARRPSDHSGVRDRPRRGAALLAQAAGGGEADPGAAGVRRQPDGDRRAGALHRAAARARSGDAARGRATRRRRTVRPTTTIRRERRRRTRGSERQLCAFCTERFRADRVAAGIEAADAVEDAGHRHLGERHGDGRPRAASPARRRCPIRAIRCCSSGYQAAGTRGRRLVDGEKTVKIHGADRPGQRARSSSIESMSAHADSTEILRWLGGFTQPPTTTFIVHGEPVAMEALRPRSTTSSAGRRRCRSTARRSSWRETSGRRAHSARRSTLRADRN